MAKRQSIWLSTMMVLALMVIGYYTVNNENKPLPAATDRAGTGETGAVPPLPPGEDASEGAKSSSGSDAPADPAAAGKGSDFFAEMALKEKQRESGAVERLQQVIADPKSSAEDVARANRQLQQITDMQGKAEQVVEMLKGAGFSQAVILPSGPGEVNYDRVSVYVQASSLSPQQAVTVMGIVHNQMGVPASNITVYWHE